MNYIRLTFLLIGISLITSCEDYLSEVPDTRTLVDSEEKISELLVGAYPVGVHNALSETMSDNAGDKGLIDQTEDLSLKAYSWDIPLGGEQDRDTPIYFWNASYRAIAHANEALQGIEELKQANSEAIDDDTYLAAEKGEALLTRAYNHFMLVNLWAEHYNPESASSDMGIPYVTEPEEELFKDYERSSVEEVYSRIEEDMLEGLSLVERHDEFPKYHFSPASAKAFAIRFYLYTGQWDNVITYANEILGSSPVQLIKDWTELRTLTYAELESEYSNASYASNMLVVYAHSLYSRTFASGRFGLSNGKREELFDSNNPTGKGWAYPIYGTEEVYNIPKFREFFEYTNISAQIGLPFTPIVLFSYDEVLLARAEAYAMQEQYGASLDDINTFLSVKTLQYNSFSDALSESDMTEFYSYVEDEYTPFYSLTPKQASFVKGISELKRREYVFEGLRWFDIKRFYIEIEHDFRDRNTMTLGKNDNRRLLQIPQAAIGLGITPNPR